MTWATGPATGIVRPVRTALRRANPKGHHHMTHCLTSIRRGLVLAQLMLFATVAGGRQRSRDRGDVPGWVLITVMTAGLVTALWIVAGDQLLAMFRQALGNTRGPGTP